MRSEREPEMRFRMALYGKDIDLAGIEGLLRIKLDNNRIYYYDKQCNMEFDAGLMERMGKLGLKLCVSCQEILGVIR